MTEPQKRYADWKQEQGLPVHGTDVTSGDTVQHQSKTPAENAIQSAVMIASVLHKHQTK